MREGKRRRVEASGSAPAALARVPADVPADCSRESSASASAVTLLPTSGAGGGAAEKPKATHQGHYAFSGDYRFAIPWWDTWTSFVKGKWIGMLLIDALLQHLPLERQAVEVSKPK